VGWIGRDRSQDKLTQDHEMNDPEPDRRIAMGKGVSQLLGTHLSERVEVCVNS
jgi:hypothetical protein